MYTFENVYVIGVWFSRTKALRLKRKNEKRERGYDLKKGGGKERNTEFCTRRIIFRVWPRSMGSDRVNYLMHHADGTLLW